MKGALTKLRNLWWNECYELKYGETRGDPEAAAEFADNDSYVKMADAALKGAEEKKDYPLDITKCPGYEGWVPKNLGHKVCKHCGNIHYYH